MRTTGQALGSVRAALRLVIVHTCSVPLQVAAAMYTLAGSYAIERRGSWACSVISTCHPAQQHQPTTALLAGIWLQQV